MGMEKEADVTTVPTRLDHYTIDDLHRLPDDDAARYEVLNGSLYVTPPAAYPHNRRAQRLGAALAAAAPAGFEVLNTGTQAVRMGDEGPCPDIVVFAAGDYATDIPVEAVALLVEVTSPSNRSTDTVTKLDLYGRSGVPYYWVVDPGEITVYKLDASSGSYHVVSRGPAAQVTAPFPISVVLD
jgi:Uma2 family endonuclease